MEISSWKEPIVFYKRSKCLLMPSQKQLATINREAKQAQHFQCLFKMIRCKLGLYVLRNAERRCTNLLLISMITGLQKVDTFQISIGNFIYFRRYSKHTNAYFPPVSAALFSASTCSLSRQLTYRNIVLTLEGAEE